MNSGIEWTADEAAELYHLDRWGLGYFQIDDEGYVTACPNAHASQSIRIVDIVQRISEQGIKPPILLRFPGIIRHRVAEIHRVFAEAIEEFRYQGRYHCLYPIKVNQHHEVVQATLNASKRFGGGLEAGSKAELLAVLALSDNETPILCNGFKDEVVLEMALRAIRIGRQITIVIEKPNEVELIVRLANEIGVKPKIGARIKLSSRVMGGHWQDSSGQRSKFGLTVPEMLRAVDQLRQADLIDCFHLLHFHPGSQINNVRKIKSSLIEAARVYVELTQKGVPLDTLDVGGGLAVDYTGQRNRRASSMNYTLREYANDVVYYIAQVCDAAKVPHPTIYSESGRAMVAHHSMIVVPILGTSHAGLDQASFDLPAEESAIPPLSQLIEIKNDLKAENVLESFHDTQAAIEIALQMFSTGHLSIDQRAFAEWLARKIFVEINGLLDKLHFVAPELEDLRIRMADTYFGNFSVFQALPDSWALNHVFPVMPIHRLDQRPNRFGIIGDLTCDSDGKIDCFIGKTDAQKGLPLHAFIENEDYHVGIFLVGAYQEALSDDHNLMGKFHIVTVDHQDLDQLQIQTGSTLHEVLEHVHHNIHDVLGNLESAIDTARKNDQISEEEAAASLACYREVILKYTYLETVKSETKQPAHPLSAPR